MADNLIRNFKTARRVSTPLIAIRTADPAATIAAITNSFQNGDKQPAILVWNVIQGIIGVNEPGQKVAATISGGQDPAIVTGNPTEALAKAADLPAGAILFFANAHRYIQAEVQGSQTVIQAAWNLRDQFKGNRRMLVFLAPDLNLPAELSSDVLVMDEPLPGREDLKAIITSQYESAQLQPPAETDEVMVRAIDALSGLAAFPAEQAVAMSLTRGGVDTTQLWERKRKQIEQTPGLAVWRGSETFDGVGGCENIKQFLTRVFNGPDAPRCIVFIDEIEKGIGTDQDTSGVSQANKGTLLSWMQDNEALGILFYGVAGTAKSMIAKAAGSIKGVPTIQFDLSGMKGSLVGESEQRLRNALKVVQAVGQGRTLFVATCNSLAVLPPELRRRFNFGIFFFDLPDESERSKIWEIYRSRYRISNDYEYPDDEGWTGAEIKQCCELSWRLGCDLLDASNFIVPVSRSAADIVNQMRTGAKGRFISASNPGVYNPDKGKMGSKARALDVEK